MKYRLTILALFITVFSFCQNLDGRWVNLSFSGEENLAYQFEENKTVKMYYAGEEMITKEPIEYTLKQDGEYYLLEMNYVQKSNNRSVDLLGLVKFKGKNQMELEFFDKKNLPEELEFTEEALTFVRQ